MVNGKFLLRQLAALEGKASDKGKGKAGGSLKDCAFVKTLTKEVCVGVVCVCVCCAFVKTLTKEVCGCTQ